MIDLNYFFHSSRGNYVRDRDEMIEKNAASLRKKACDFLSNTCLSRMGKA